MVALVCGTLPILKALDLRCGPHVEHDIVSVEKGVIL